MEESLAAGLPRSLKTRYASALRTGRREQATKLCLDPLPKGGGAVRGMERSSLTTRSRHCLMTVPITTIPGRSGSVTSSRTTPLRHGPLRLGCRFHPSITRKTERTPQYDEASSPRVHPPRLGYVPVLEPDGRRHASRERAGLSRSSLSPSHRGLFARIERWTDATQIHWAPHVRERHDLYYETQLQHCDPSGTDPAHTPGASSAAH